MAAQRRRGPPLMPNIHCPYQRTLEDVPIVLFDMCEGSEGYLRCMKQKKRRERAIAPFQVGEHGIPVTPFDNPRTGMSSHHIIRVINGLIGRYLVDLFMRDRDMYFLAFRRHVSLTEDEIQRGKVGGWGRWHRFSEAEVPDFLNARDLGIPFSYIADRNLIKPGGLPALMEIYYAYGEFNDDSVAGDRILIVSQRVMTTFSEPSRLRSMLNVVGRRIHYGTDAESLAAILWGKIQKWTQLGVVVLVARANNRMELHRDLPAWCHSHELNTMNDLIGPSGELMLINHHRDFMGVTEEVLADIEKQIAGNVQEPNFQPLP